MAKREVKSDTFYISRDGKRIEVGKISTAAQKKKEEQAKEKEKARKEKEISIKWRIRVHELREAYYRFIRDENDPNPILRRGRAEYLIKCEEIVLEMIEKYPEKFRYPGLEPGEDGRYDHGVITQPGT